MSERGRGGIKAKGEKRSKRKWQSERAEIQQGCRGRGGERERREGEEDVMIRPEQ